MKDDKISHAGEIPSVPFQCQTDALHRILVVDDDNVVSQFSAKALTRSGYQVDIAEDGEGRLGGAPRQQL